MRYCDKMSHCAKALDLYTPCAYHSIQYGHTRQLNISEFSKVTMRAITILSGVFLVSVHFEALSQDSSEEEVLIISDGRIKDTSVVSPTSRITAKELQHISFNTVEDAISHEPSVIVRRRFIGDPNGVIGIRSSNMFQGTRSMVFADGMPLHYHLQTRFSGSPRWSLVSPSEIAEVEVIYGPFSAEYSGNAMGGVVNMTTKTPDKRKVTLQGTLFSQDYSIWSTEENYVGGKAYVSYEDRIDNFSFHLSYNHLENDSQPQTQYNSRLSDSTTGTTAGGGFYGLNEFGDDVIYYADSGEEHAVTDLFKAKFTYDIANLKLRGSIAYEERDRDQDSSNNFIQDQNGNTIWNGTVIQDGQAFSVRGSNFQNRHQNRNSLLTGLGLSGDISRTWLFDAFYSNFRILDDEEIRTARNPLDPNFIAQNNAFRGRITEFDDTGWDIFDIKFGTEELFGNTKQRLSLGLHMDSYKLNIIADDYNAVNNIRASDERDGDRSTGRSDSGGEASNFAVFAQYGYALSDYWDLALGLRYEDWESKNGFSGGNVLEKRTESGWSPKFSLGFTPTSDISLRYSLARALRFPIIEELYRNDGATSDGSVFVSDPSLQPEDGIFHNFSIEKLLDSGSLRLNIFYDVVDDVIFNQSTRTDIGSITTSLPVEEVTTKGAELAIQQQNMWGSGFDIRYNLSYIDTEISKNVFNPDIVGNDFPRMPTWRSNVIINYPINNHVDISGSIRYASDSSGRLDNTDT